MITTVRYALGSMLIGVAVFALKYLAYWLTGSTALYSDALESIINIVAAGAAVAALRVSAIPADANHPYGHTKAEYFSAVAEGVLIVGAAGTILYDAVQTLFDLHAIAAPIEGLALNAAATVLNGLWAAVLVRQGQRLRSPALTADGKHLYTDVVTSIGVFAGVALVALTGWLWLDPLIAAAVALNILWSGWQLVRASLGGLMDEAVPEDELDRIRTVIFENSKGAYQSHDLRTRHAGRRTFIDFHLVVAGDMPVERAHEICDRLETALENEFADCTVTIHVEPEHKAEVADVYVPTTT
ncbi:MAG: cation-efflux pump [Xanthomonadales bacterium]|nr:cation-efflux pump [Xanthomonadales bacterium]|tara:strand:+ start:832 stop:1728 length:897 start_codon:yes stop_codon:yes gene_type:complete